MGPTGCWSLAKTGSCIFSGKCKYTHEIAWPDENKSANPDQESHNFTQSTGNLIPIQQQAWTPFKSEIFHNI